MLVLPKYKTNITTEDYKFLNNNKLDVLIAILNIAIEYVELVEIDTIQENIQRCIKKPSQIRALKEDKLGIIFKYFEMKPLDMTENGFIDIINIPEEQSILNYNPTCVDLTIGAELLLEIQDKGLITVSQIQSINGAKKFIKQTQIPSLETTISSPYNPANK